MSKWNVIKSKIGFAGAILVLLSTLAFVEQQNTATVCEALSIHVSGAEGAHFISEQRIRQELLDRGAAVVGASLVDLDIIGLEEQLKSIPSVKEANVYHTMDGTLHAELVQRVPIVRIMDGQGNGYYVDADGYCMPLSEVYTPSVFLVQTAGEEPYVGRGVMHVMQDEDLMKLSIADEAFRVATVIEGDEFWKRMFDHAAVSADGTFQLVPRVGGHRILIGEPGQLHIHLAKLRAFYEGGIDQVGWRAYKQIDLRFADQIVCTKK